MAMYGCSNSSQGTWSQCLFYAEVKTEKGQALARNVFNIRKVWNPVYCHGNETVELKLWSTFSKILLQRIKHF